jgi:hypothetical protein
MALINFSKLLISHSTKCQIRLVRSASDLPRGKHTSLPVGKSATLRCHGGSLFGDQSRVIASRVAKAAPAHSCQVPLLRTYTANENKCRSTDTQLIEARTCRNWPVPFLHGKRGGLHQEYGEGQEDQLGTLGLVAESLSCGPLSTSTMLWISSQGEGHSIQPEHAARLFPLVFEHILYGAAMPSRFRTLWCGAQPRPLCNPTEGLEDVA